MNLTTKLSYLNPLYMHEPVSFTLFQFLKKQGIKLNNDTLQQELSQHPYYPSLLSISDVLNGMGIPHEAYQIGIDAFLKNFHKPLFTHLKIQGKEIFAVIEHYDGDKLKIITEKAETQWYSKEEFEKIWNGVLLELTNEEKSHLTTTNNQKEIYPSPVKYGAFAFALFVLGYLIYLRTPLFSIQQIIFFVLNSAGIVISWILVLQHLNKNNILVKQLCQSKTQEGCDSVLNSKTSQITSWLSIAEAGLIYFTGATLSVLLFSTPIFYFYLALIAPLYSLYAIYIQAFVLKEWCRLCMGIHAIVFTSSIFVLVFDRTLFSILAWPGIPQFIVFLILIPAWLIINTILKKIIERGHYKQEYLRFKVDPELFKCCMNKQPKVNIPNELKVFSIGNLEAEHELTFVSNPFCGPCAEAHKIIEEWLQYGDLDFKITVIFSHANDEQDRNKQFVEWISGITAKEQFKSVLHNWFNSDKKDFSAWARKLQLNKTDLKYDTEVLQKWMDMAEVKATPTFFINGYRLSKKYQLEDIKYLITEIEPIA